ncbi:hypothetical protein N9W41_00440 [bacterium]|nr:hypothetical protein [bacterium]
MNWLTKNTWIAPLFVTLFIVPSYGETDSILKSLLNGKSAYSSYFHARSIWSERTSEKPTLEEYKADVILHRNRVKLLMVIVAQKTGLNVELVKKYSLLHDLPKIMSLEDLREYGYTHEKTILERLYEFHGRRKESLNPKERKIFDQTLEDMEFVEQFIKAEFFSGKLYFRIVSHLEIVELKAKEHLADTLDSSLSREKELGGKTYSAKTQYQEIGDIKMALIVEELEEKHRKMTGPLFNDRRRKAFSCKRFFFN